MAQHHTQSGHPNHPTITPLGALCVLMTSAGEVAVHGDGQALMALTDFLKAVVAIVVLRRGG